jgi:uncharacterized membrane protein YkvA (DUF1232 family)
MDEGQKQAIKRIVARLPSYIKLIYRLYRDDKVPDDAKLKLSLALGYNISPIDLIPGFIPLVGQIDNVYFSLVLLKKALEACDAEVAERHLKECRLDMNTINGDIDMSLQLMKYVGKTVLSATVKVINKSASAIYGAGKKLFELKNEKKENDKDS